MKRNHLLLTAACALAFAGCFDFDAATDRLRIRVFAAEGTTAMIVIE